MAMTNDKPGRRLHKSKTGEERYIKVNQIHYEYRAKTQSPCSMGRAVPWINIKGHWLREAGFEIDAPVKVRVMDGCLVLTLMEPSQSDI